MSDLFHFALLPAFKNISLKMPKFSANLGFLFLEGSSVIEQFQLAKRAGFRAVELPFPTQGTDIQQLLNVKNELGLEVALVNIRVAADEKFGCAALPSHRENFKQNFQATLEFAKMFKCPKIHLMSGKLENKESIGEYRETYMENLKYAAESLERENIIGVIEPINHFSVPAYFLSDFKDAISVIKAVGSSNIKLMIDLFHMQLIQGNIINSLTNFKSFIGHVQVAQSPDRHEPDSNGEVNLKFILDQLDTSFGYSDWIGCEYKPLTSTVEGLKWINNFGYEL